MDLDLSRLAATTDWSTAADHAVATLAAGATEPLLADLIDGHASAEIVRVLVDNGAIPGLASALATAEAAPSLAQLLTGDAPSRRSFEVLAGSRAVADIGQAVTGTGPGEEASPSAGPLAWRDLAWTLVRSRSVRSRAKTALSGNTGGDPASEKTGSAEAEAGAGFEAGVELEIVPGGGRRLARSLGHDDAGRSLVRYLVNSPVAEQMAVTLTSGRRDHAVARSLVGQGGAIDLADSIVRTSNGHRLAWDLTNSRAGRTLALALTGTASGRKLVEQLATDETGRRLAEALIETDVEDGLFTDPPRNEVAILRLVLVIALVLFGLIEPQALGALILVTAAAVAAVPSGFDLDGVVPVGPGQRHRITVDVGPSSTMGELAQILADLDVFTTLAVRLALTHGRHDTQDRVGTDSRDADGPDADGTVLTWRPAVTGVSTDGHVVEQVRYQRPLEVVVASGADLATLTGLTDGLDTMVALVERRRVERRRETGAGPTSETTELLVDDHPGGRAALDRLGRYAVTVEPLTVADRRLTG